MDRALWPATVPEMFCDAAGRKLFGQVETVTTERLRTGLGLDQPLQLPDRELARDLTAAREDPACFDQLALGLALAVGRQLTHQYPSSSLLWDFVQEDLADVLAQAGFAPRGPGAWTMVGPLPGDEQAGRTVVVELAERPPSHGDERRFTVRWGVVLAGVPFCRHGGDDTAHDLACCAVVGGLGAVREPFGDHCFVLSVGLLAELQGGTAARLVGREGFRARLYRLAAFCGGLAEGERLAELVAGQPWRSGIGIAEQLRNADPRQLRRLLA